jgi:hypothetical protein
LEIVEKSCFIILFICINETLLLNRRERKRGAYIKVKNYFCVLVIAIIIIIFGQKNENKT